MTHFWEAIARLAKRVERGVGKRINFMLKNPPRALRERELKSVTEV